MSHSNKDIVRRTKSQNRRSTFALMLVLVVAVVSCGIQPGSDSDDKAERADGQSAGVNQVSGKSSQYAVAIRRPAGPPRVAVGKKDIHGKDITVACSTCHTTRQPNHKNRVAGDLNEFHRGMKIAHGSVSCLSCHNPKDYDTLKLADGSPVEYVNVMKLCAQCHGPQMKDYEHGAHGGMKGHWDLRRGPRVKNNCIDCHNPHAPQFPKMQPQFKPKDRFLNPSETNH